MSQAVSATRNETNDTPFRNLLKFPDNLRYVAWTLLGRHTDLQCRLRCGPALFIRSAPSSDWETAYEIFRLHVYDTSLAPESVQRVVDVGGNVGYSCLFWCWRYPHARVLTYEPHPSHCELIKWHLQANGYSDRVTVIEAGAAAKPSTGILVDDGIRSRIVQEDVPKPGSQPVLEIQTADFFETVGPEPIDILKIDIEGGEYELLQDPRFEQVANRSRCILMEWHKRAPHHLGGQWCAERIGNLGFTVTVPLAAVALKDIGMLVGMKRPEAV
jgi:FkbM family methyltransferase